MGVTAVRARTRWAWISSALALATTTVYGVVIMAEGDDSFWDAFPWVTLMLIGTGAMATSAMAGDRAVSRAFAVGGAVVLGILGVVAIFSVGTGFFLAAVAAAFAAAHSD